MELKVQNIQPFVRRVGIATNMVQERFLKSYDHRLLIPLSAGGSLEVAGDRHTLSPSNAYLVPPDVDYRVQLQRDQKMVVINFDWTMNHADRNNISLSQFAEEFNSSLIVEKVDWSRLFGNSKYVVWELLPESLSLARIMVEKYLDVASKKAVQALYLSGILQQMIAGFMETPVREEPKAKQIYKYICENYTSPLTLEGIAGRFHFHPTYVNRLLNNQYGKSFRQLLIRVRLKQALNLLDDPTFSIKEISEKLGFFDYKHFQQSFLRYYGITPAKYRSKRRA